MQIKSTMSYHFTTVRKAIIKTSVGKDMEKRLPLYFAAGNVNWNSHHGKQYGDSSKY
jgi:hypothetical protein